MKRSILRRLLGRGQRFVYLASLLTVGLVLGVGQAQAQIPDPSLKPNYGSVMLNAGFKPDPFTKTLKAGGNIKTKLGGVNAHVTQAPDFGLIYIQGKGNVSLRISVESKGDTTLLINLPNSTWIANDDGGTGNNPQLIIEKPISGRYDIWVGTLGPQAVDATLKISEVPLTKVEVPKKAEPTKKPGAVVPGRLIVCTPIDWVQVNLDAGLGWFGRDVPGIREEPETKDSLAAMLKKHGFETQYKGVKGKGDSVKLQLFARLTKETRTPNYVNAERGDRELKAIADMVYGGQKAVGKKVYMFTPK
jgi:hypothetical protein